MRQHEHGLGQFFRHQLAHKLSRLGYTIDQRAQGLFDIAGLPEAMRKDFSNRHQAIVQDMALRAVSSAAVAAHAQQLTRPQKQSFSRSDMIQRLRSHHYDG